jgi:PAS domain S-box-containing protein
MPAESSASVTEAGARILFAGDGRLLRTLKAALGPDMAVVAMPDGRGTVTDAREIPPDLLIADASLPDLDGTSLVRMLRADARTRDVTVILLSSIQGADARLDALEAGADEVLVEPFDERELAVRVRGLLRIAKDRRAIHEAHRERGRELRQVAEKLRIVTDTMGVPVTRCTPDLTYAWANQRYADWIGLPLDHIVGRPIAEVIGLEAFASLCPKFERVLAGEVVRYEEEVEFRGIGKRWIDAIYTPTLDDHGRTGGWVAVVSDITERRRNEQRIASDLEAITRLHAIATECGSPDADFDATIEEVLDAAIALVGCDKGNVQLVEPGSNKLRIVAQRGFDEPFLRYFDEVGQGEASACSAALDSGRVIVEDVTTSTIFLDRPSLSVLVDAGVRAVQSTPLVTSTGKVVGVVSTHSAYARRFDERELRFLDLLAHQVAEFVARRRP